MKGRLAQLCCATAMALVAAFAFSHVPAALAQSDPLAPEVDQNALMLLEADELVYDNDRNIVTARGQVRIDYDGNRLVAREVSYDRNTKRLMARGNVEIIDSEGTKISSDEIDITDDFGEGFVNALRVETTDKTYFGAESATRRDGNITTFNNGVYTACAPCEEQPDRPPIWRIKSQRIVWNGKEKTIRFTNARFELFGLPIAFLPVFETADHTVKRKSGFLFPGITYQSELGVGVTVPYYFALSPTYDLTASGTYYTKQGFLGEAEWRQRFDNGQYSIRIAGIDQRDPQAFRANTVDRNEDGLRAMIGSEGRFTINPRWTFGWDVLAQTDRNFAYTYDIEGYSDFIFTSQAYLTGLNDRNYFDLRGYHFQVQDTALNSQRDDQQPWVLPSFDYTVTPNEPIAGGELRIDLNARSLNRDVLDRVAFNDPTLPPASDPTQRLRGIEGLNSRMTGEAEWKRTLITDLGLVVTPLLHLQGDVTYADNAGVTAANINQMAGTLNASPDWRGPTVFTDIRSAYYRYMATAGLELRYPILFSTTSSSHILEPVAQVFVRPDERYGGTLGIPNEDAQSLVFDAATLFERDKFSGYDRIEGGTRANIGFRYSGMYANGWSTNAIFGQSFHLAGRNPYASPDLVNVGAYSGLESDRSDYVGLVGLTTTSGISLATAGRFDEETFAVRRAELRAGYSSRPVSLTARYAFIEAQPLYGAESDRHEVTMAGSSRFAENWRVFGSGTFDLQSDLLVRDNFGFAYDDECFSLTLAMTQTRARLTSGEVDVRRNFGFNISFRTIGEFGSSSARMSQ